MAMKKKVEHRLQIWGWVLFIGCAVCYIFSSFQNREWITLVGGLLFLLACILFLIPLTLFKDKTIDREL